MSKWGAMLAFVLLQFNPTARLCVPGLPIQAEFKQAAAQFGEHKQEYDAERLREQVFETVQANKVMEWLTTNCTVTVEPPRSR